MNLNNKIALVTGASDQRGIGFAIAKALINQGATVAISDLPRRLPELNEAVAVLGDNATAVALDITDEDAVIDAGLSIKSQLVNIDILVNNAGSPAGCHPFLETTSRQWASSWQVNIMGTVNCCKAVLPDMQAQNSGVIINISSLQGLRSSAAYGAYTTHKHALIGLTRTLACEFGQQNIRVLAVCPGVINTAMNDLQVQKLAADSGVDPSKIEAAMGKNCAMNRIGQPQEIANVVAFLASDNASYMNGNAIEVGGGFITGMS